MKQNLAGHRLPNYTNEAAQDALFHYTTANGLLGILQGGELWSTAYHCVNDQSELSEARGTIRHIVRKHTSTMIENGDAKVDALRRKGVDIRDQADRFEDLVVAHALNALSVYMTCFCRPTGKEEFLHGLLSQWRGYGSDGGYAIQFNAKRLKAEIERANSDHDTSYDLQDICYHADNPFKDEVLRHEQSYIESYEKHLDDVVNFRLEQPRLRSPITDLPGGPLEAVIDYLVNTKSSHFSEENECRLSVVEPASAGRGSLSVEYLNREGLVVPFTKTPSDCKVVDCIDWVVVGPSPNIEQRFRSISQMVKKMGLDIKVRPSHIPYMPR